MAEACDGCLCGIPADSCRDIDGAEIKVGQVRSVVIIETDSTFPGRGMIHLGPAEREHFNRLYQAAETAAEAWSAAHPEGDELL